VAKTLVIFFAVLDVGLLAGIVVGIWLGYNPASFSYTAYIEYQQGAISAMNILMPLSGLLAILLTTVFAIQYRHRTRVFTILIAAIACLMASGFVTKFGNQPINATVMTWTPASPPGDWSELRARWWTFHQMRTALTVAGFCLVLYAALIRDR
jgi:hypothetical protein